MNVGTPANSPVCNKCWTFCTAFQINVPGIYKTFYSGGC